MFKSKTTDLIMMIYILSFVHFEMLLALYIELSAARLFCPFAIIFYIIMVIHMSSNCPLL